MRKDADGNLIILWADESGEGPYIPQTCPVLDDGTWDTALAGIQVPGWTGNVPEGAESGFYRIIK